MSALDFQTLAQVSAGRALNTVAEGMAIAFLIWIGIRVLAPRSAVTRFTVWFSTLLAIVVMPFLVRTGASGAMHRDGLELSGAWATGLFIAWAVVAGLLLIRLGGSLCHVWRLRRDCLAIDRAAHPELIETLVGQANGRDVKLLVSDKVRIPTAIGFFHPAIVLPQWTLDQLSADELNAVVLHELAHLHRWDDWTNLAQKVLKAIFFFHPAVWFIESRLALEREIACDDFVIEQTASAQTYAASLVSMAEKVLHEKTLHRSIALAQSAIGKARQISSRIAHILQAGRSGSKNSRSKNAWRFAVAAGAVVLTVTFVATPYTPELVSFKGPAQSPSVATAVGRAVAMETPLHVPAIRASMRIPADSLQAKRTAAVLPARAKLRASHKPKVMLAKANTQQQLAPTLLVFQLTNGQFAQRQSADLDSLGSPVWSLCIWRVTAGPNGVPQIEETIVVNRI